MGTNDPQEPKARKRIEAVQGDDAVILNVDGEEFERIPVDAEHLPVVAKVIQTVLGDDAYLVEDEPEPGE
jgi:hypothetical protein